MTLLEISTLEDETIRLSRTLRHSVTRVHIQEERRPQLYRCESLKIRTAYYIYSVINRTIVTITELLDRRKGFDSKRQGFFSLPPPSDQLWDPPILLRKRNRELFPAVRQPKGKAEDLTSIKCQS
jgi:hypothetical protein